MLFRVCKTRRASQNQSDINAAVLIPATSHAIHDGILRSSPPDAPRGFTHIAYQTFLPHAHRALEMYQFAARNAIPGWKAGAEYDKIILLCCVKGEITLNIAVCDDQAAELKTVVDLIHSWQETHHAALRCQDFRNASELLDAARKERFTLYLLDVMMPGISGMDAAREIRSFDNVADIVFLTSSPGFAYESYGVKALEYLLKPIHQKALFPILDRLFLREQKPQEGLTLKVGSTLVRVPFSQLAYVEVRGKHLYFHLTNGQVREVVGSLKNYKSLLLARPEFMHIHRSYIVNMLQIEELSPAGVVTFSGQSLPISRLLYSQLQKDYMQLLFSERNE